MDILTHDKQTQYAWAGGFFDGEGHIGFSYQKRKSGIHYPAQRIMITQWYTTTSLESFRSVFDCGVVERHSKNHPDAYRFRTYSPGDIERIMTSIEPFLSERKINDWNRTRAAREVYLAELATKNETCSHGHNLAETRVFNSKGAQECSECKKRYSREYRERRKNALYGTSPA